MRAYELKRINTKDDAKYLSSTRMRRAFKRGDRQRAAQRLVRELRQEFHEDSVELQAFFNSLKASDQEHEDFIEWLYPQSLYDDYPWDDEYDRSFVQDFYERHPDRSLWPENMN